MGYELLFAIFALLIYVTYNVIALHLFNVPVSLSQTYYLFKNRKEWQRILFPIVMLLVGCLLLPSWLKLSDGSNYQFLSFLSCASIMFTAVSPAFNRTKLENKVHTYSAYISALFAVLWIILVAHAWNILVLWIILILLISISTNTFKSSYIYWLETIAIMSTLSTIISKYFNLYL